MTVRTYQRFGLQTKFKFCLSPERALKLASGADFGCNRHCKANPVDLEGSRVQVLMVLGGFGKVLGGGGGVEVKYCHRLTAKTKDPPMEIVNF